jgi:TetR/AcrR family transcriptional regulator, ethionamide resistance regulator
MASITDKAQTSDRGGRRDELSRQLLDTVETMIEAGESFAEISVRRMVAQASISRSSFYQYFIDKSDLVRNWLRDVPRQSEEAVAAWLALGADLTYEDLRNALSDIFVRYRPHATVMAAVHDAASYDSAIRDSVRSMMQLQIDAMATHIAHGQSDGWVDPDARPVETAAWIVWMAERGQHQLLTVDSQDDFQRRLDALTQLIWRVLYAYAPARN